MRTFPVDRSCLPFSSPLKSNTGEGTPVFMMTRLENLSGASLTTLRPVRPPQSWHTRVRSFDWHKHSYSFVKKLIFKSHIQMIEELPESKAMELMGVIVRVCVFVRFSKP